MAARLEADQTLAEAIRVIVNHFDNVNQGTTAELRQTRERLQHSEATSRRIQRIYRERLAVREATIADQQNELEELREENAALEWEAGNHGEVVQQMRRDHERAIARLEAQLAASRAAANMSKYLKRSSSRITHDLN